MGGAAVGLALGLWEAGLLYFHPSVRQFIQVDAANVIWFLAPLMAMVLFSLLGGALGCIAVWGERGETACGDRTTMLVAVLLGAAGAYVGWSRHFLHTLGANMQVYDGARSVLFPLVRFAIVFVLSWLALRFLKRAALLFALERTWPLRPLGIAWLAVLLTLLGGLTFYANRPWSRSGSPSHASGLPTRPNIVLITLDTVRADHLSAYGYSRPTTPQIDHLAAQGVLFENAIAASSWTLPSLASIFTGLLPHQGGANAFRPVNLAWETLAEVLDEHGYTTAGFNANYFYGESGWGLAQGFHVYDDDATSLGYNLSRTLVGRVLVQPVYQATERYDVFYRRNAQELNADVFRWLRNSSPRPYFLFINYYDAHGPYLAPAPYDRRFGRRIKFAEHQPALSGESHPTKPRSAQEQADLIDGYDDCLNYLDTQVGELLQTLESAPGWKNTIVILTSDHGEAFGEHGAYHHGCDLHGEEIHVPLIFAGRGVPAGVRVSSTVETRRLFATVLDLALGAAVPFGRLSVARDWEPGRVADNSGEVALSELSSSLTQTEAGTISLTSSGWHYIRSAKGDEELYRRADDPGEKLDLSRLPQYQPILEQLRGRLEEVVAGSLNPWLGPEYLRALGGSRPSIAPALLPEDRLNPPGVGSAQAYFTPASRAPAPQNGPADKDLLESLPYH